MGKIISSVAIEIKAAELNGERVNSEFLPASQKKLDLGGRAGKGKEMTIEP
jgi:hypothetical protein